MDLELHNRNYFITGGSSGLGLAVARSLVNEGANVAICGRNVERLEAAVETLIRPDQDVIGIEADVTNPDDYPLIFEDLQRRWRSLDGLVNNAGGHTSAYLEETTDDAWYKDFDLKVMAILRGVRTFLPMLRRSSAPAILNVLSVFARYQYKGSMPSSMFRSAGLSATNSLALDLAEDRIRVNAALIGFVHSSQWIRASGTEDPEAVARFEDERAKDLGVPLGRAGKSEEFGDIAAFLLSPRATYVTGTAIHIDGGLSPVI
jgi:NAD(P)-dependent dehydrogenase (short-subunit alcohol dehydrogenase family)